MTQVIFSAYRLNSKRFFSLKHWQSNCAWNVIVDTIMVLKVECYVKFIWNQSENHRNLNSSVINFLNIELNSKILAHLGGTQRGLLLALDKTGFLHWCGV